ncbi:MAG: hypothetical protein MJ107_07440 [Lachnospiraceae bacterium]|nr:hypothetical protein [Lachnospiraceae bacterium]
MLSTGKAKKVIKYLIPLFIAVLSFSILAPKVSDSKTVQASLESIDNSQATVLAFAGATTAASLAMSAFPDDFATPLANTLSNMNKYFIFILIVLFVERLILTEGIKVALAYLIPIACGFIILGLAIKKDAVKAFGNKLFVLALAVTLVVPCSTKFTEVVCADYLVYVDETIEETSDGAGKINDILTDSEEGDTTLFEKISNAFKNAVQSISDLLDYFNNLIKKGGNSIAILIVTNFVLPILTLFFFKWLFGELFALNLPAPKINILAPKRDHKELAEANGITIDSDEEDDSSRRILDKFEEKGDEI